MGMTVLVVCGQDIRSLSLGLVRDGALAHDLVVPATPETYLSTVASALAEWKVALADLGAVVAVTGPGSFTSSRVSTVIANAVAFARGIPVYAVPNVERRDLRELVAAIDFSAPPALDRFAIPTYDRPPHIT